MATEDVPPWQKPGQWVKCGIAGMGVPKEPMPVTIRDRTLYLLPGKTRADGDKFGDLYPVVALVDARLPQKAFLNLTMADLSSLNYHPPGKSCEGAHHEVR